MRRRCASICPQGWWHAAERGRARQPQPLPTSASAAGRRQYAAHLRSCVPLCRQILARVRRCSQSCRTPDTNAGYRCGLYTNVTSEVSPGSEASAAPGSDAGCGGLARAAPPRPTRQSGAPPGAVRGMRCVACALCHAAALAQPSVRSISASRRRRRPVAAAVLPIAAAGAMAMATGTAHNDAYQRMAPRRSRIALAWLCVRCACGRTRRYAIR